MAHVVAPCDFDQGFTRFALKPPFAGAVSEKACSLAGGQKSIIRGQAEKLKVSRVPKRLFEQPTRLVFRHAGITIIYQENDGHLGKRDEPAQKSHISHETWPDLESAARAFWNGQVTWAEISWSAA